MTPKKIVPISTLTIFVLLGAAIVSFYIKFPEVSRCYVAGISNNFVEVGNNVLVSNDTPDALRDSINSLLNEADQRVCEFWNADSRAGNPVILFCNSKSLFSDYSKRAGIITYKTPLNCYIVFGEGYINLDMLSHELFHTELYARTGYFNNNDLPTWFDEGLAMQVDHRKDYSEEKYQELKDSVFDDIKLSKISTPETFYAGNYFRHFILAKHEVSLWLDKVGEKGLQELIIRINDGEEFSSVYNTILTKGNNYGRIR